MNRPFTVAAFALWLTGCGQSTQPMDKSAAPVAPTSSAAKAISKSPERKDIVVLTPRAAAKVTALMKGTPSRYLRISVSADLQRKLDLDEKMDPKEDYLGESRGVQVIVDRKSAQNLPAGIVVDYVESKAQTGFSFSAPEPEQGPPDTSVSLAEARRGLKTTLARRESGGDPLPKPPPKVFQIVRYDAPVGKLGAYLTPDPKDGKKRPAIIWITGGDCNSIDDGCWADRDASNDQSASAYRKAGIVMMFPSLRGGNDNPGVKEGYFGEVDDVLAAADFLKQQPHVDAQRVYLGGHSSGGTLALLTAECSDRFRAVFSFGPTDDVIGYPPAYLPFVFADPKELRLRAPGRWLHSIRTPTFVIECADGNLRALQNMARASKNPNVRFFEIKGADHFDLLAPTNRLIAERILRDTGPKCTLTFTADELNKPFQ